MSNQLTPEEIKYLSELLEKVSNQNNQVSAALAKPAQTSEVSAQGLLNELTGLGGIVGGVVTGVTVPLAGFLTNLVGLLPTLVGLLGGGGGVLNSLKGSSRGNNQ